MTRKTSLVVLALCGLFLLLIGTAGATTWQFTPTPADLGDLDHWKYYTWGINEDFDGETIVGATLYIKSIRNWDANPHDLYIHLLGSALTGVRSWPDSDGGNDNFVSQGVLLAHYDETDFTTSPVNRTIDFSTVPGALAYFNSVVGDNNFGLGLDPDCHYYNDGITLTVETAPVPEPATLLLVGGGLLGLAGLRRRFRK